MAVQVFGPIEAHSGHDRGGGRGMTIRSRCFAILFAGFAVVVLSACGGGDDGGAGHSDDTADEPDDAAPVETPAPEVDPTESEAPAGELEDDVPQPADPEEAVVEAPEPSSYDFSAVSPIVQTYVDDNGLNGAGLVVVQRDDGVIYEEYWGEFDADRISLVASSSKMISAGVLLHLADEGLLDIDAPVSDVVDWGVANPGITPAHLISSR